MKFDKRPPATTRAWIQLLAPSFTCHTCGRGSSTEHEHLYHVCDALRVWVLHTWRRLKVYLGLWSWAPKFPNDFAGNIYNDGVNTAVLPPFEECGACRENDLEVPHDSSCSLTEQRLHEIHCRQGVFATGCYGCDPLARRDSIIGREIVSPPGAAIQVTKLILSEDAKEALTVPTGVQFPKPMS